MSGRRGDERAIPRARSLDLRELRGTTPHIHPKRVFLTALSRLSRVSKFAIYGFFSDTIAQTFFPPSDTAHTNLVLSYVVFGGAFLVRPLGGVLTGHIGDKFGRKRALVFSLGAMTVPTVAMGCLPTYAQVGGWSTALLVICRLLQGFSVGGQLLSSLVYSLETKPREHWGYYGSLVVVSLSAVP